MENFIFCAGGHNIDKKLIVTVRTMVNLSVSSLSAAKYGSVSCIIVNFVIYHISRNLFFFAIDIVYP